MSCIVAGGSGLGGWPFLAKPQRAAGGASQSFCSRKHPPYSQWRARIRRRIEACYHSKGGPQSISETDSVSERRSAVWDSVSETPARRPAGPGQRPVQRWTAAAAHRASPSRPHLDDQAGIRAWGRRRDPAEQLRAPPGPTQVADQRRPKRAPAAWGSDGSFAGRPTRPPGCRPKQELEAPEERTSLSVLGQILDDAKAKVDQ